MKKIVIILIILPFLSNSTEIYQNKNIQFNTQVENNSDTIRENTDNNISSTIKYKTDSMLTVAEKNNKLAAQKLNDIKLLNEKNKQLDKDLINLRKELKSNIKYTVQMLAQREAKLKETNKNKPNYKPVETKIDSIYQKGTLFKKSKWIYHIEIDGKNFELINK